METGTSRAAIALRADGASGYVLDGWGGVHPFGGAPAATGAPSWPGQDIAKALTLRSDGRGWVLDGAGGMHPINGAGPLAGLPYWRGGAAATGLSVGAPATGELGVGVNQYGRAYPVIG